MNTNIDFNQIKAIILPYFIQIYGEEYNDIIVDRLNKIVPVFYSDFESQEKIMFGIEHKKKAELIINFLEKQHIYIPDELKEEIIESCCIHKLSNNIEASNLINACFGMLDYNPFKWTKIKTIKQELTYNEYDLRANTLFFQRLGFDVNEQNYNEWVLSDDGSKAFDKVKELLSAIDEMDSEYSEFDKQFVEFKEKINQASELKNTLNEKYMLEFLTSIKQYMDEHDKSLLENYINNHNISWYEFKQQMFILKIVGEYLCSNNFLEAFSSKSNIKLNDTKTNEFSRKCIQADRMKYYKQIGIYHDQMPEDEFLKTDEALSKGIPPEIADEILSKKEYYNSKFEDEYFKETSTYKSNMKTIENIGLVTEISPLIQIIKNGTQCINPNVRIVNGKPEAVALLFFSPQKCLPEYIDVMLIHEINHAIELSLIYYGKDKTVCKCGFENLIEDGNDNERNYEQFSEVLNQIIAMEITEAMHNDNVYLFDNPATSRIKGGTSYEQQRKFVQGFWEQFRKEIIYARVNTSMDRLFEIIGRENYEQLNNIINEYKKLPYYQLIDDIIDNKTTELTIKANELIERTVVIYKQMKWHLNNYEEATLGKAM